MEQADCKKNIRTFIAIPLPEKIILFLVKIQEIIKTKGFKASWSKMNAMHLTLKFIGDTRQDDIDKIIKAMEQTAECNSPLSLSAGGVGLFPSVKKARIIFAGLKGETDILAKRHNDLETNLARAGFEKDNRRFSPHITLARIKGKTDSPKIVQLIKEFQNYQSENFICSSIYLFKSELKPSGALHTELFSTEMKEKHP